MFFVQGATDLAQGVAMRSTQTIERTHGLAQGTVLSKPWHKAVSVHRCRRGWTSRLPSHGSEDAYSTPYRSATDGQPLLAGVRCLLRQVTGPGPGACFRGAYGSSGRSWGVTGIAGSRERASNGLSSKRESSHVVFFGGAWTGNSPVGWQRPRLPGSGTTRSFASICTLASAENLEMRRASQLADTRCARSPFRTGMYHYRTRQHDGSDPHRTGLSHIDFGPSPTAARCCGNGTHSRPSAPRHQPDSGLRIGWPGAGARVRVRRNRVREELAAPLARLTAKARQYDLCVTNEEQILFTRAR